MKISIPIKKTVYGPVNTVEDLRKAIAKSGQFFGQDLSGPACNYNASYPCNQTLYEYMGWGLHKGLDIPVATGTDIYAAHDGYIQKTSETASQGIGIVIRKEFEYETVYWHNKENKFKVGDTVKAGDLIAISNNTGFSGGPHLHFEFKLWDGSKYEAVDPMPYFKKMTEEDIVEALQVLEGYKDVDGQEYWAGQLEVDLRSGLIAYLKARLSDKIIQENQALESLS